MNSRRFAPGLLVLILAGVGSSGCASLTTPRACMQVCEVQESEPCQNCLAEDKERRDEERRNNPPPPSMPSGGGSPGGY